MKPTLTWVNYLSILLEAAGVTTLLVLAFHLANMQALHTLNVL